MKAEDQKLIEAATGEISQDSDTVIVTLCLLLARIEKFKDQCE